MKKIIYLVTFLAFTTVLFSQEKVSNFIDKDNKKKDVFSFVDENNNVTLFFSLNRYLSAVEFDDQFKIKDSLGTRIYPKEYYDIIGTTKKDDKYFIYWSTKKDNEIVAQSFDVNAKKVSAVTKTIELGKEKIIDKISIKNKFYIITVLKNTSVINFYCFDGENVEKKSIDCTAYKFIDNTNRFVTFWDLYNEFRGTVYNSEINNILNDTPASLVLSTNKKKAYIKDNSLLFTFDNNQNFTQLITFNLDNYSVTQKAFPLPVIVKNEMDAIASNSFLVEDKLIQIKLDSSILHLLVSDLQGNIIKNTVLNAGEDIAIKNSEIIQESGSVKNQRILDSSKQLIRKIYNLNPAVSCYLNNGKYYMVIGGVSYPQQSASSAMLGGMFGVVGALVAVAITSNYAVNNINSYSDKKIVYINSIFDADFNHIKESSKDLAFDKLRLFIENHPNYINQTVFKKNNILYYAALNKEKKENKEFSFFSFKD